MDGVLHDVNNKKPGYKLGVPIEGAPEAMRQLKSEGAIITIHSVWADTEQKCQAISKWCRYFDIPYDFITNQKPLADAYLDDKAVRFYDWEQALNVLEEIKNGKM
jgi:hypothetical protein